MTTVLSFLRALNIAKCYVLEPTKTLSFAKVSLDQTHPVTSVCLLLDCRRQPLSSPVNRITTGDAHFCTTSVAINQAALTSLTTAHSASGLTAAHILTEFVYMMTLLPTISPHPQGPFL